MTAGMASIDTATIPINAMAIVAALRLVFGINWAHLHMRSR